MGLERVHGQGLAARVFAGQPRARLALLRALWPAAVGPEVARRTEIVGLENDVLRVRVADARSRKALFRVYRDLIVKWRRSAGTLGPARLGFIEGPVAEVAPPAPAAPIAQARLPESVAAAAASISDVEIRQGFLESAARYLGRAKS